MLKSRSSGFASLFNFLNVLSKSTFVMKIKKLKRVICPKVPVSTSTDRSSSVMASLTLLQKGHASVDKFSINFSGQSNVLFVYDLELCAHLAEWKLCLFTISKSSHLEYVCLRLKLCSHLAEWKIMFVYHLKLFQN